MNLFNINYNFSLDCVHMFVFVIAKTMYLHVVCTNKNKIIINCLFCYDMKPLTDNAK